MSQIFASGGQSIGVSAATSVHPIISPEYSLEGLMLKLKRQHFGHLMRRTDSLEETLMLGRKIEGRMRRERQRMRWLDGINGHELGQTLGDGDGLGSLACCSPWGRKESYMTE